MVQGSGVHAGDPVRVTTASVRLSVAEAVLGWGARRLIRLVLLLVTTPPALVALGVGVALSWLFQSRGATTAAVVAVALVLMLVLWGWWWPVGFSRWVRLPVRSWRRSWSIYRWRWATAMGACGLTTNQNGRLVCPVVGRVRSSLAVDRVRLRMLPGQTFDDYAEAGPRLAQTFGAPTCRVRTIPGRVQHVELWLLINDPLAAVVPLYPADNTSLAGGLAVARAEDGGMWRLQLVGSHVLVVGATGAGKGSVIWSILVQLAPAIRTGVVKVWAIDPKGGIELGLGRRLFDRFCHGDATDPEGYEAQFAQLLEEAVDVMRRRLDRMRGVSRLHHPTTAEPLIVLVVDEIAALTGWISDRALKKHIETALGLLLSQGRAAGVVVVGAVQDPRKEVLPMRDLFPVRIALRLNEPEDVALVLGSGARNRGALCDRISTGTPGVGYVTVDGVPEPLRVRFSYVDDDAIGQLGAASQDTRHALHLVEGSAA